MDVSEELHLTAHHEVSVNVGVRTDPAQPQHGGRPRHPADGTAEDSAEAVGHLAVTADLLAVVAVLARRVSLSPVNVRLHLVARGDVNPPALPLSVSVAGVEGLPRAAGLTEGRQDGGQCVVGLGPSDPPSYIGTELDGLIKISLGFECGEDSSRAVSVTRTSPLFL